MCPANVAQLVANRDNLCRGWSSNPGFHTSPHIMCVNLAIRLLDKKKKKFALHPAHFARALQPFQIYPCASVNVCVS